MKIYTIVEYKETPDCLSYKYDIVSYTDLSSAELALKKEYEKRCKSLYDEDINLASKKVEHGYEISCDNGDFFRLSIKKKELKGTLYTVTELNDLECEYPYASCRDVCNNMEDAIRHRNQLKLRAKIDLKDIVDEDENYLFDGRNSIFYNISEINL